MTAGAFAHVTDRDCRECDGTGVFIDACDREYECKDCCGTGKELE